MSLLFQPLRLGALDMPNRIVIAPMCQYAATDGNASDWHTIHLGHLALSGAGLLIIEATAVTPEARISPADLGLYSDDNEAALGAVLATVRRHSPIPIAVQLAHAGRKASTRPPWDGGSQIPPADPHGWQTEAPSAIAYAAADQPPVALDHASLGRLRKAFAQAARRAARLGLDGIEIHAAHGYLLHEFLSPLANRREDDYGGCLENRMRFPLEIYSAVRDAFPAERPVWVRISATDWVAGGWDLDSSVSFAHALQARGCETIHVSSGGLSSAQSIPIERGYQLPFAARIKADTGMTTIGVGLITEPAQAEAVLAENQADAVALARAMLYDPRWPWHAAVALGAEVDAPKQYWRSPPRGTAALFRQDR